MPENQSRLLRMAAARADFLEYGRPGAAGVPDIVAASWLRSQEAGVDISNPVTDFNADIDPRSRLVRCAQPVLDQLGNDSADLPLVIALTYNHARLVQRLDCSTAVARLLDRVEFAPGFNYAEGKMGTNGVGTVLEAGRSVSVVGPEHFTEQLQPFACTGAPIIDPLSGRMEGILDISALADTWSPLMHTLVKSAAKDIGRNLLLDRNQAQQALFDTYLRADARSTKQAVFAFADSVFMANATAQALFDPAEQLAVRQHATFLMARRDRVSFTYEGLDGEARRCTVAFSREPEVLSDHVARFELTIASRGEADLYLEVGAEDEGPPSSARYRQAKVLAKAAMRRRLRTGGRIQTSGLVFNAWLDRSRADLALLTTDLPTGPYPYAGIPWFSTAFGRDAIIDRLHGPGFALTDRTIDSHIRNLRAKFSAVGAADIVETRTGIGYRIGACGG